jgi:hypothetical protein
VLLLIEVTMTEAKFEKITNSATLLYGPPKLLICGFPKSAQSKFKSLVGSVGLAGIPLLWATKAHSAEVLSELLKLPDSTGLGESSDLPRAVIVSGIQEKQLHSLMALCRKVKMQPAMWAVLTPISERWTLQALLSELQAERKAMQRKK